MRSRTYAHVNGGCGTNGRVSWQFDKVAAKEEHLAHFGSMQVGFVHASRHEPALLATFSPTTADRLASLARYHATIAARRSCNLWGAKMNSSSSGRGNDSYRALGEAP
ncbi:hypothetical protein H310_12467 [Aphanomyces invadans]|uniref:Uncharacterized protein n=1 Tax=Aphanomyces invadans TaxID=157072 RepID=A0A024TI15_9STRA|nr:hypothetical protein H310_12467 [Aphanomyces invadans]ETV93703.1 hypothetical protein H310_12467 [Aphanomyces invadans]|eukprot:XP_008877744.1 hypothetical protein H310_12467 [Aphanomyces invadans]